MPNAWFVCTVGFRDASGTIRLNSDPGGTDTIVDQVAWRDPVCTDPSAPPLCQYPPDDPSTCCHQCLPEGSDAAEPRGYNDDAKSIARKACASSTDATMGPGGAEYEFGNGWDTDNNGNDFFVKPESEPQGLSDPGESVEPMTQASGVYVSSPSTVTLTVSWTNGDGSDRIVLMKSGGPVDANPVDGASYLANSSFGAGDEIGTGNYAVYDGSGTTVTVTGLNPGATYHVAVYEYNDCAGKDYLLGPARGSRPTLDLEPTSQASDVSFTAVSNDSMEIDWTNGDGSDRIVLMKSGGAVDANPVDGASYLANSSFGAGSQLGAGNYVVYSGSGSSVSVSGLDGTATYHVAVYEYNGSDGSQNYLLPPATGNETTLSDLTVNKTGTGSGKVTSSPAGIDCGATCSAGFVDGTSVTLTATPNPGSAFDGWSGGGCLGNGECTFLLNQNTTITATFNPDGDLDGISDAMEDAGPNGGDGNRDGAPDSVQANVATFKTINGNYVTLISETGSELKDVVATVNPSTNDSPELASFPKGFFGFKVSGLTPGQETTVILILHERQDISTYYKYGPTPDNLTDHWYQFLAEGATGARIVQTSNQTSIFLDFIDGQRGDDDLLANGEIADLGAPTTFEPTGDGGCFVSAAAYQPAMTK